MNIEDRITQLEKVIESMNIEVPFEVLPIDMWGKVGDRHYVMRSEGTGYGGPEIVERHVVLSDDGKWGRTHGGADNLKCTPTRWEDVPDDARWAK